MGEDSFTSTFSRDDTPRWDGAESFLKEFDYKRQAVIDEFDEAQQGFFSALTAVHAEYAKGEDPLPSFEEFYECLVRPVCPRLSPADLLVDIIACDRPS